jgi:hypothetical protein
VMLQDQLTLDAKGGCQFSNTEVIVHGT